MYNPIKSLGQNFLSSPSIVNGMIDALDICAGEDIIEIGPGHGVLTDEIAKRLTYTDNYLIAVEIDKRFYSKLQGMYLSQDNVDIIQGDILDFLPKFEPRRNFRIIGSLPYYITSPIIHQIIRMDKLPESCVLLIQEEVAQKIIADKPDSSYMSCFVNTFFETEYLFKISKEEFDPVPKVDGGVIKLIRRENVNKNLEFKLKFEGFLHKSFSNPRKMLNKVFKFEELEKGGLDASLRPQNLNYQDYIKFYETLNSNA